MPACLLDVNVWLAAAFSAHPAHGAARRVVTTATAIEPALWCRATQQSFLRLASTPVITAAYLAAFAIAADVSLISFDQDFRQFEREGLAFQLLQADGQADATA